MINRDVYIENIDVSYYVGIGRIKIDYKDYLSSKNIKNEKSMLDLFFSELDFLEKNFYGSTIQFIKDEYLINEDHLFTACYHTQKAFINNTNISNRKNLELLLYLSSNRQIKNGIKAFGIDSTDLFSQSIIYCIISPNNNLIEIKANLLKDLYGTEVDLDLNKQDIDKYDKIMKYFKFNNNQVDVIINSRENLLDKKKELKHKFEAIFELICEKMALLSLEKIKLDYV